MSRTARTGVQSRMAAAVVSLDTRDLLRECLTSLGPQPTAEVVVVDNGSTDGSAEMVRREFPHVRVIVTGGNRGYAAASNLAIAACRSPYVLLLNADTRVLPGTAAALERRLDEEPRCAIVAPRLLNPDGSLQPSCHAEPSAWATLLEDTFAWRLLRRVPGGGELVPLAGSHTRRRSVAWVKGAALAIRRGAFDAVGRFDEAFFLYYEEVDLCARLRSAGWEVHFEPAAAVVHVGGASAAQRRTDTSAQRFLAALQYHRKHGRRWPGAIAIGAVKAVVAGRWLREAARARLLRDPARRADAAADLRAWSRVLGGGGRVP